MHRTIRTHGFRRRGSAVGIAAGLVATLACGCNGGATGLPAFPPRSGPLAYVLDYRVDVFQTPPSTNFEQRVVRRPFDGRILTSTGPLTFGGDVGDAEGSLSVGTAVYTVTGAQVAPVQARAPGPAIGDQALDVVLDEAVSSGVAERGGRAQILGRPCRIFDIVEPGAAVLSPVSERSRTEICVDDDGLVLRERWHLNGTLVLAREAIAIDTHPAGDLLEAALSAGATGDTAELQAPRARRVASIRTFLREPPVPAGFTIEGRYETGVVTAAGPLITRAWAMRRRGDYLVVEVGSGRPNRAATATTIPVSGLGTASLTTGVRGSEAVIDLGGGQGWVRVTASAPASWLRDYVMSLRRT